MAACARVQAASVACAADCVEPDALARSRAAVLDNDPPLTSPAPCDPCAASVAERPPPPDPFCAPVAVPRSPCALEASDLEPPATVAAFGSVLVPVGDGTFDAVDESV